MTLMTTKPTTPPQPPPLPPDQGPWMTAEKLADYCGFSLRWIYKMATREDDPLPGKRAGRSWRFSKRQFDEWLARQEQKKH